MGKSKIARVRARAAQNGLPGLGWWAMRWLYWRSGLYRTKWHLRPPLRDSLYLNPLEETAKGRERSLRILQEQRERYKVIRVNTLRFKVDLKDYAFGRKLFLNRIWEDYESGLFFQLLQPGMNVLDIGAHIGYYALFAAQRVGSSGRVFAFEPAPDNFALLAENVRLNRLQNILTAENLAVSDRTQQLALQLSEASSGDHRIFATSAEDDALFNKNRPRATHPVQAIAVDEYLGSKRVSRVDAVKMDVQGAEMNVLRGMEQTLRANPDLFLFFEYWYFGLKANGTAPQAPLEFLQNDFGYQLFLLDPEARCVKPIERNAFVEWAAAQDPRLQMDLIATRAALPKEWM